MTMKRLEDPLSSSLKAIQRSVVSPLIDSSSQYRSSESLPAAERKVLDNTAYSERLKKRRLPPPVFPLPLDIEPRLS